jgi:prepilin-type processing-associated H-X9-DG protein
LADPNGPPDTIVAYDKEGNHDDGRNVLFLDGHVGWMDEAEFQLKLAEQQVRPPEQYPSTE